MHGSSSPGRRFHLHVVALIVALSPLATPVAAGDEDWSSAFAHAADLDGPIYSMVAYGDDVVVAGGFTSAGNTLLCGVAQWDGAGWRPLGDCIPGGGAYSNPILSLAVFQDELYAEGWRLDGGTWTDVLEIEGHVSCMEVHGDLLVVGGSFDTAQGVPADNLIAWDGESAVELGGGCNGAVRSLLSHDGSLYAGGGFTEAGGIPAERIACWNGESWSDLGGGVSGDQERCCGDYGEPAYFPAAVMAIGAHGEDIYVGGQFTMAGGDSISALARWDGVGWHAEEDLVLGDMTEYYSLDSWLDFPPCVQSLAVDAADGLVAGGRFSVIGDPIRYGLIRRDEGGWSHLGGGFDYDGSFYLYIAYALLPVPTGIFVGGQFYDIGGIDAVCAAFWDESAWSPLVHENGLGTDGHVFTSLDYQDDLIFAGGFRSAGGVSAGCIASFHGDHWGTVGDSGIDGTWPRIRDMVVFEQDLVVAGRFESADGVPAANVARWDGAAWQAMGPGLSCYEVAALCVHAGKLYAAGGDGLYPNPPFYPAAKQFGDRGYVYRWSGEAWELIITTDEHVTGAVSDLASYDGALLVAGSFSEANGQPVDGLLCWDGSACEEFGGGLRYWVRCLEVVGDDLYVGGGFTVVGDVPMNYLARWDGSAWHDVAGGLNGGSSNYGLYDLLHAGGRLYAGGRFDTAGDIPARNVAVLDGDTWRALGSGAGPTVTTLAWRQGDLYVGGKLEEAGGLIVGGLARWEGEPVSVMVSGFSGRRDGLAVELVWEAAGSLS
ncbi:hypothetical protein KKG45_13725, partial [bacterium]|nr:hypothetical protein [bacterium]